MKPVLVLFNAVHFPAHVRSAAIDLATRLQTELVALAVPFADGSDDYPFPNDLEQATTRLSGQSRVEENRALEHQHYRLLQDEAAPSGITYRMEYSGGLDDLVRHTADAALLVVDAGLDFPDIRLQDVFVQARCPVFIADVRTSRVEKLVLAYDASAKSRYAIQAFARLFPAWPQLPAYLVSVNVHAAGKREEEDFLNHWFPAHFPNGEVVMLEGEVRKTLTHYLEQYTDDTLVVMGAFGRGAFSRFFNPSAAEAIIEGTGLSLFVAHA